MSDGSPPGRDDLTSRVAALQPKIRQILAYHRVPYEDAADLLQETLLSAFRAWDRLHEPERYILNVLRRRCLFYWGSRRRERLQFTGNLDFLEALLPELAPAQQRLEMLLDLDSLLRGLAPQHRALLVLRYRDGRSCEECAQLLGYSARSIRALSSRLINRLIRRLETDDRPAAR